MQPEIAHHGGDQRVAGQLAGLLHGQREDHHDRVAVDNLTGGIDGQAPVGIAVVGQAEVGAVVQDRRAQHVQMRRAAAVVDVQAVGFGVDRDDPRTGGAVGTRCGRRGGAVCAVHDHGQPVELDGAGLADLPEVTVQRILGVDHPAHFRADGTQPRSGRDQILDLVFGRVVELVPARPEDLDAVVGHRVVRRGDHHAEVGVVGVGQVGHRRGRQHTGPQRVDALTGQAGDHGGFQHLAAGTGIATDHRDTSPSAVRPGQPPCGGGAEGQRELGGELAIGDPADAVSAE